LSRALLFLKFLATSHRCSESVYLGHWI
jgi:hypothetical protein